MTIRNQSALAFAVIAILGTAAVLWCYAPRPQPSSFQPLAEQKPSEVVMLSRDRAALLRSIIYNNGLSTNTNFDRFPPQQELALQGELIELHRTHRVATIKLLSEIVVLPRPVISSHVMPSWHRAYRGA